VGAQGWRVRVAQERLQWLGYEIAAGNLAHETMGASTSAAVKAFQIKYRFRPTGVIGPGTWDLLGEVAGTVGRLPKACVTESSICIDKSRRLVRYVVKGRPVLTLDARFGFVGAETREGAFRVNRKSRDHISSLYRTSMPFALFFSGGQAVHYSPYFARDGYNGASHGCVNLRDYDRARWLFDHVDVGTRVYVYRG
jgi:peptidoglycan hydrolase-like protein with peptidoglycan-binding domain